MTKNQLEYLGLVETRRNNMVVSDENERHNRANEFETNRSNVARETETNRHNLVVEDQGNKAQQETNRHNLETEKAAMGNLNYQYADLAERTRHNKVSEGNQMKVAKISAEGQKTSAAISAEAQKSSAAMSAEASKYGADKSSEASKYGADTQAKTAAAERKWRKIENQKDRALDKWKTAKTTKSQKDINTAKIASDKYLKNLELNRDLFKFNAEQKYKYDKLLKDYEVAKEKNDVDGMGNILRTISSLAGSYLNFAGNIARGK